MPQYDGSIRINTQIEVKNAEKELKGLEGSISKTADKIASLRQKMDSLKDVQIPTQEYKEVQKQIEVTEKKINDLMARQEKFLATGGKESSTTYKGMQYDLEELQNSLPYLKGELQDLVESGKAFTLGSDTEKYAEMSAQVERLNQQMQSDTERQAELQDTLAEREQHLAEIKASSTVSDQEIINLLERRKELMEEIAELEKAGVDLGYQEYEDKNRELEQINSQIKEYKTNLSQVPKKYEEMQDSAKKAFNAISEGTKTISEGTKKSSGLLSTFSSRLKGLAISLLIFNWISKAFRTMISGMKEGFTNFAGYSDSFANSIQSVKNSLSTLGNQIAAAFAPIVQAVIPWLNSFISVITKAITYLAQFIALLSGKSTFTRAKKIQDSYNKSLGGTAAAAKKAAGALAAFDKLNVLNKNDDNGGGGGAGETDFGDMFEEVPVDSKLQEWLDSIIEKAKELKKIFMKGFWDGLGDWKTRVDSIKKSFQSIKDSLKDIFTDPAVVKAADKWVKSVVYMLGTLVGATASIGLTIATNIVGGIAKYLKKNKDRIKKYLVSMFNIWSEVSLLFADLFKSIAYIFEAFASESGQELTANVIGIFADAFMGITELASKLFRDILDIIVKPFVDNREQLRAALEEFLGILVEVTGTIKQGIDETFFKLNEVYDEHLKPFFDSVAQGLSDLIGDFLEFWNGNVQPMLSQMAADFDELWKIHLQPFINKVIQYGGKIADLLKALWNNILKPLISWIIKNILPVVTSEFMGAWKVVKTAIGGIINIVGDLFTALGGIIDFLTGVFTGDWEKAWNGAVDVFRGIFNTIPTIVETIINSAIDIINKLIGGVNKVSGKVGIPSISEIPHVSIPRLATGAVIRGGNPFMAILGDQPAGQTNIETPLPTMVKAFKQALAESGWNGNGKGATPEVYVYIGNDQLDDYIVRSSRLGALRGGGV